MTHIMENIIFNEVMIRECSVDIGIVYGNEKNAKGKITPVIDHKTPAQSPHYPERYIPTALNSTPRQPLYVSGNTSAC